MLSGVEPLQSSEIRVLGSLIEKDITTPEYYPLTLNALVNACNQKSSRDPVVSFDEATVHEALAELRNRGVAGKVSGAGHRVEKFGHSLGEKLNLGRREIALLCVLMLRGAQTVGELRSRTERMYEFSDMEEVESVLDSLASRDPDALVARLPRGRWAQLLGGDAGIEAANAPHSGAVFAPLPHERGADERSTAAALEARVAALESEVEDLKAQFAGFRKQFE